MGLFDGLAKGAVGGIMDGASKIISDIIPDPNQKAQLTEKIQELVTNQATTFAQLAEQQHEADLKDTDSARQMQIAALKQDSWLAKNQIHILAIAVTLGFFGLLAYMLKYDVPASNKSLLDIMLGSLGTAWITIMHFYYGSTGSSKTKDETIKALSQ